MPQASREEQIQKLITILKKNGAFAELPPEDLNSFAQRADFVSYEQGAQVVKQGELGTKFFVILSGQVRAVDLSYDPPHLLNYMPAGTIFGTQALLKADRTRAATVEVVADTTLAEYDQEDWNWLCYRHSRIEKFFRDLERERIQRSANDFPGRQWDEVVVIAVKRHVLAFIATLTGPLGLLIAPIIFILLAELAGLTLASIIFDNAALTAIVTIPFIFGAILWTIYNYLDWRNDDFIVTTKRVIHIERVLLYGEARDEAPLIRIQDVTVASPTFLLRKFDYNHLQIKTAGAGVLRMSGIPNALKIKELIFQEREQASARVSAADLAAIRYSLARQLNWEETLTRNVLAVAEAPATLTPYNEKRRRTLGPFDYLWPRVMEVDERAKDGPIMIWRKHYFVLMASLFLPVLAILASTYLFIVSLLALPPLEFLGTAPVQILLMFTVLGSMFWYIWEYDGWRKDIYIATRTRIMDIEGSPFHIRGERRREGTFDNIQNITYDIPNFFYKLLNLGSVVIETAGTKDTFTFINVFNPSAIQQEIFNRMVLFQQRKREEDRDATTARLVQVIGEYHYLYEKVNAQNHQ